MVDKEILQQYANIKKEIRDLEARKDKVQETSTTATDLVQNGYKRHLVIKGIDITRIDKINRYRDRIEHYKDKLLDMQIKVEEFIQTVDDSRTRMILRYRYLDDLTWVEISLKMREGRSPDAIKREIYRFFEKK